MRLSIFNAALCILFAHVVHVKALEGMSVLPSEMLQDIRGALIPQSAPMIADLDTFSIEPRMVTTS